MAPRIRPQTYLSFGPIRYTNGWSMTTGPGARPGTCVVVLPSQAVRNLRSPINDLVISEGNKELMRLKDCHLVAASSGVSRAELISCTIQDRRWRWPFAFIDGNYNKRQDKFKVLREKTPRELASLLLDSMGETNYSVSSLPNNTRPQVNWQSARSDAALLNLCNALGCYPVLDYRTDRVQIEKIGDGQLPSLPEGMIQRNDSISVKPQPYSLRVVGGPSRFQSYFKLEAMGLDVDEKLKPIEELSYFKSYPGGSDLFWRDRPGAFQNIVDSQKEPLMYKKKGEDVPINDLASQSCYRIFRVSGIDPPFSGDVSSEEPQWSPEALKGGDYEPTKREDINLANTKLSFHFDDDGVFEEDGATAFGFYVHVDNMDEEELRVGTIPEAKIRLDTKKKLVYFSEPAFLSDADAQGEAIFKPATLLLDTSYTVNIDGVIIRWEEFINNSDRNTWGDQRLKIPELVTKISEVEEAPFDNLEEVRADSQRYLQEMERRYTPLRGAEYTLEGFYYIPVNGVIRQVTYSGGGGSVATTRFSANSEHSPYIPSYESETYKRLSADKADRFEFSGPENTG